ncbi:acyltransferase [Rhodanobacter sp. L36]|uniref:acyltransferase family protein n=1 Tax=Rhodanobacter sp. L36 TaxID=1747221 RepID=UPI00131E7FB2|nr:acyltransferase [Rhodanobacter sp. L36]
MNAQTRNIPVLNGIRALAIAIVFASHASNIFFNGALTGFGGGQLGVMLFFVLSGFLMACLYMERPATVSAQRDFVVNRLARIYPMFFVVVAGCFIIRVSAAALWVYPIDTWHELFEHLGFVRGYEVLWTIGAEVIFYVLFLVLWKTRNAGPTSLFIGMVAAMVFAAWVPLDIKGNNSVINLHDKLPYFILGCLLGMRSELILSVDPVGHKAAATAAFWISLLAYVASLPQILRLAIPLPREFLAHPDVMAWASPFYLVATTALFVTAVRARPWILTNKAAVFIGKISFSFYLLHYMVLENVRTVMPTHPLRSIALALMVTMVLSALSYATVEVPMRNWIRRIGSGRRKEKGIPKQSLPDDHPMPVSPAISDNR